MQGSGFRISHFELDSPPGPTPQPPSFFKDSQGESRLVKEESRVVKGGKKANP